MVCRRCIIIVTQIFQKHGTEPLDVQLGKVTLSKPISKKELEPIQQDLENCGFEVIDDKRTRIIEQIRTAVIQYVHYNDAPEKKNL